MGWMDGWMAGTTGGGGICRGRYVCMFFLVWVFGIGYHIMRMGCMTGWMDGCGCGCGCARREEMQRILDVYVVGLDAGR
jgi:hypothetical protein